jgi:Spy/CpxP family protein refolding chaperone
MKATRNTKSIVIAAVVLIAGATFAFAHGGWGNDDYGYGGRMMGPGYGGNYMMGPGYGGNYMMGPGWGRGYHHGYGNLSDEDRAKIDAARDKFYDETRSLRRDIDDKAYDLNKEMDKDTPDANKVAELQKQLSKLQSEFDQKRVQHRLEMRKLLPENYQGSERGYYGRGGNCWQN